MLFNKRTINTLEELNFCLAVCRVLKVTYLSILLTTLLLTTCTLFDQLSFNAAITLSLASTIILSFIHVISHIKDKSMRHEELIQQNPIEASIWELYKVDGISIIDKLNDNF